MVSSRVMTPQLAVVICTWNRGQLLSETLSSLLACDRESLARVEVLVVDNGSIDNTRARVESACAEGRVRYVYEPKPGLSLARNAGVRESQAPWILFLDDDVLVRPSFVSEYLSLIGRHHSYAFFGGPIIPNFAGAQRSWTSDVLREFPWAYSCLDLGGTERPFEEQQYPFGANMCIRRELLLAHPFSPDLGYKHGLLISGEESALFAELKSIGARGMWSPSIGLIHVLPTERNELRYLLRRSYGQGIAGGRVLRMTRRSGRWAVISAITSTCQSLASASVLSPRAVVHAMRLAFSLGVMIGAWSKGPQDHPLPLAGIASQERQEC